MADKSSKTFSIEAAWGIAGPCFVRKVDRGGHWKDATVIAQQVLCLDPRSDSVSVFQVESDGDLSRVAVALNAARARPKDEIRLVAVLPSELNGISILKTGGQTPCFRVNGLHRDLVPDNAKAIADLASQLFAARTPKKFKTSHMEEAIAEAESDGCRAAVPNSQACVCDPPLDRNNVSPPPSRIVRAFRRWVGPLVRYLGWAK